MTASEFNTKYKEWLVEGHYGLAFNLSEDKMKQLDEMFQMFIQRPDFKYQQIKQKFGMGRFYADGTTCEEDQIIEKLIED